MRRKTISKHGKDSEIKAQQLVEALTMDRGHREDYTWYDVPSRVKQATGQFPAAIIPRHDMHGYNRMQYTNTRVVATLTPTHIGLVDF
jgi:hypothetical protein